MVESKLIEIGRRKIGKSQKVFVVAEVGISIMEI